MDLGNIMDFVKAGYKPSDIKEILELAKTIDEPKPAPIEEPKIDNEPIQAAETSATKLEVDYKALFEEAQKQIESQKELTEKAQREIEAIKADLKSAQKKNISQNIKTDDKTDEDILNDVFRGFLN